MSTAAETLKLNETNQLTETDPLLWDLVQAEHHRQQDTLEMIASENHTSPAVRAAVGSCLTNKYCEGYPGKRYYSGCHVYDQIESLAIDRARRLFDCQHANVQPHSGAGANLSVFFALLEPGDTYLSVVLADGGHLTHGLPVNLSGKWFNPVHYPLVYDRTRPDHGHIDYEAVRTLALEHKPKLIICGYSAYPRIVDFKHFRETADACGALLMADMAHIAGLVAAGVHPSPFPHCHVVTSTTHKTLRGPRGGLILTDDAELAKKIDRGVFPGTQSGPLMHAIAGKAVCFEEVSKQAFKNYARQIVANAAALADELIQRGFDLSTGGTDNHLLVIDLRRTHAQLTGKDAAHWLEQAGIITNKNTVPNDDRSPFITSGIRLGTPALTTRRMKEDQMRQIGAVVEQVLSSHGQEQTLSAIRARVTSLCKQFPIPN